MKNWRLVVDHYPDAFIVKAAIGRLGRCSDPILCDDTTAIMNISTSLVEAALRSRIAAVGVVISSLTELE